MSKFWLIYSLLLLLTTPIANAQPSNPTITHEEKIMTEEQPKRRGPKPVLPVEINNIRYEVVRAAKAHGLGQDGGIIAAIDITSGKELWTLIVYQTHYDQNEEQDVQEVYITKLSASSDKKSLLIENEAKKTFTVDLMTKTIK